MIIPTVGEASFWDDVPIKLPPLLFRGRARWALMGLIGLVGMAVAKAARALREHFLSTKIDSRKIAMRVTKNKLAKFGQVFLYSFSYPGFAKRSLGQLYNSIAIAEGKIPACPISELVPRAPDIKLRLFEPPVPGNASGFEIACLCALVRHLRPPVILEIGTFNGNTTLQLAANTPQTTRIYTLDLPWDACASPEAGTGDIAFIMSEKRKALRFACTEQESKIERLYGDSLSVNFSDLLRGEKADFIFVDAGHSYECVMNDSEKSFSVLNKGGVIIWHDYGGSWPSVYKYLNELSKRKNLRNIEGTELVVYIDA